MILELDSISNPKDSWKTIKRSASGMCKPKPKPAKIRTTPAYTQALTEKELETISDIMLKFDSMRNSSNTNHTSLKNQAVREATIYQIRTQNRFVFDDAD